MALAVRCGEFDHRTITSAVTVRRVAVLSDNPLRLVGGYALSEAVLFVPERASEFLSLNASLDALARVSPRKAQVIELIYFGGLNLEEMAQVMDLSITTISREQRMAEAWLSKSMSEPESP